MNPTLYTPITDFITFTADELYTLACELGLSMSQDTLLLCQQYYVEQAKRTPTPAELLMLDGLVSETASAMEYQTVAELYADETYLADTYADMMARRRVLSPNVIAPPSFSELATLGRKHLDGSLPPNDKKPTATAGKGHGRKMAAKRKSKGYEDELLSVGGGNPSASVCREPVAVGDTVYSVFRGANGGDDFDKTLDLFLASTAVVNWAKEILPVDNKSAVFSLLPLGKSIEFTRFSLHGEKDLLSPEEGAILIADAPSAADLLMEAHDLGLRVQKLGRITKNGSFSIPFTNDLSASFDLSFLGELLYAEQSTVEIGRGSPEDTLLQIAPTTSFTLNKTPYSVTKVSASGSSPFHAALYAAVGGMSAAVASGADPTRISIATTVAAPENKKDPMALGSSLAAILGLYRAEAEFSLYNCTTTFEEGEKTPTVTIWTMAPAEKAIPDTVVGGGTKLYYLEPQYNEGGLPDFESFRKLYAYIYGLNKDGLILSARAASGDLFKALGKMSLSAEIEYIRSERIMAKLGGILVESKSEINGVFVARTEGIVAEVDSEEKNESLLTNSDT